MSAHTRIYKYDVEICDTFTLELPLGAKLLAAGEQVPGRLVLWAQVAPGVETTEVRTFGVYGTGHSIESDLWNHLFTVQASFGLVWHIGEYVHGG